MKETLRRKYTPTHEWIHQEEDVGTVGITLYAQRELGEVVYVELPKVGKQVKAGEEVAVLESTKAAADIYSPVSGTIIAVNDSLKENISLINTSPEREGWLFKIALEVEDELSQYLNEGDYTRMISS